VGLFKVQCSWNIRCLGHFPSNFILRGKIHSSKNLKGLFEFLLSFLNEKSQNVENRHERRLKLQEDIPRFSNSYLNSPALEGVSNQPLKKGGYQLRALEVSEGKSRLGGD